VLFARHRNRLWLRLTGDKRICEVGMVAEHLQVGGKRSIDPVDTIPDALPAFVPAQYLDWDRV